MFNFTGAQGLELMKRLTEKSWFIGVGGKYPNANDIRELADLINDIANEKPPMTEAELIAYNEGLERGKAMGAMAANREILEAFHHGRINGKFFSELGE